MNEIDVLPAGTVTLPGPDATPTLELLSETTIPPVGATPDSVTVPVTAVAALPLTEFGATEIPEIVGTTTASVACAELPAYVAEIVALVFTGVDDVVAVNVPLVLPAEIRADAGTLTTFEVDDSFTVSGPVLAPGAAFRTIAPVELLPPVTDAGDIVRLSTWNGVRVITDDTVLEP